MVVVIDERAANEAAYQELLETDTRAAARALFMAWLELVGRVGLLPAVWQQHEVALLRILALDEVRNELTPLQRQMVDVDAPTPRCGRCDSRLVGAEELQRRLCGDCALEFLWDAEQEVCGGG